jgi:hypothetical protein
MYLTPSKAGRLDRLSWPLAPLFENGRSWLKQRELSAINRVREFSPAYTRPRVEDVEHRLRGAYVRRGRLVDNVVDPSEVVFAQEIGLPGRSREVLDRVINIDGDDRDAARWRAALPFPPRRIRGSGPKR